MSIYLSDIQTRRRLASRAPSASTPTGSIGANLVESARGDHAHPLPTPAAIGAAPTVHTHTASQISDSTATGRALLTAADAAAGRTALGVAASVAGTTTGQLARWNHVSGRYEASALNTLGDHLDDAAAAAAGIAVGNMYRTGSVLKVRIA